MVSKYGEKMFTIISFSKSKRSNSKALNANLKAKNTSSKETCLKQIKIKSSKNKLKSQGIFIRKKKYDIKNLNKKLFQDKKKDLAFTFPYGTLISERYIQLGIHTCCCEDMDEDLIASNIQNNLNAISKVKQQYLLREIDNIIISSLIPKGPAAVRVRD